MSNNKSLQDIIKCSTKALLIGIGGGGDIVGTIPTGDLLNMFGVQCVYGGISWERSVFDPVPGPRTFEETKNVRKLNDVVWFAEPEYYYGYRGGVMQRAGSPRSQVKRLF